MLNPVDERRERRRENPTINTRDFDMTPIEFTVLATVFTLIILLTGGPKV
jgi:hypothetical protein